MVDQRRFDNQHWLDAEAAARRLGVKRRTLYAYVSRGLLRSVAGDAGRLRCYAAADVERLKARAEARSGHQAVAAGALRWGEPVLDTTVSSIDRRGPVYRGIPALELIPRGFEATAELLWASPAAPWTRPRVAWAGIARLVPRDAAPGAALALTVAAMGLADGDRDAAGTSEMRGVIAALAASCARPLGHAAASRALARPTLAGVLASALGARGVAAEAAIDQALVLLADHELNASTFTARVAASTGTDLYAVLGAALAAHAGPRHGGHSAHVEALIDEALRHPGAELELLRARRRRGEEVHGFGHFLYPDGDPRCPPLMATAARLAAHRPRVRAALALAEAARRARLPPPSTDFGLVATASALGLPRGSAALLFAIGRSAGWIAHALEQQQSGVLLRPRARYVG
jgi:citrate synthase